eukprot:PhF_6_TR38196/c0_g1_i1/m.57083
MSMKFFGFVMIVLFMCERSNAIAGTIKVTSLRNKWFIAGVEDPTLYLMRLVNYTWSNRSTIELRTTTSTSSVYTGNKVWISSSSRHTKAYLQFGPQGPDKLYFSKPGSTVTGNIKVVPYGSCFMIKNKVSCDAISALCRWNAKYIRCSSLLGPYVQTVSGCLQQQPGLGRAFGCRTGDRLTITGLDFGARNKTAGLNITLLRNNTKLFRNASAKCIIESYNSIG